uniref:A to I editase domain-containing protein n=1 Tax=Ditylenchus dipsaci TaxID=166011 RepID=A0A915E663_9BILA
MQQKMDPARYEQLKNMVAEYGRLGKLDVQYPISPATLEFLNVAKKDSCSLVANYCNNQSVPNYPYYGFELAGRTDHNKYLCISEHEGNIVFGVPCASKKNARSAAALRILDYLMAEGKLTLMTTDGKKKKQKKGNQPKEANGNGATEGKKNFFADDVDFGEEFKILNPTTDKCANKETMEALRDRAFTLFTGGFLNQLNVKPETKLFLDTCGFNPVSLVNMNCGKSFPEYFNFVVPTTAADKNKYVCLAKFEDGVYYGNLSPSKALGKAMCAAAIAEKLLSEGRVQTAKKNGGGGAKKRPLEETKMEVCENTPPSSKQAKISQEESAASDFQLSIRPEERLDVKTVFYLILNHKNPVVLLAEFCQKQKYPPPTYEFTGEPKTGFAATVKFAAAGEEILQGLLESNKKLAKSTAARVALNWCVLNGRINVPEGTALPSENISPANAEIFEKFKSMTYEAFQKAALESPLISYCNNRIAAIFLTDAKFNKSTLVSWPLAKVLCRRGLMRFIYAQVKLFTSSPNDSIFYGNEQGKLCLRPNLSFHMYSNEAPNGDAVDYLEPYGAKSMEKVSSHAAFDSALFKKGSLSLKTSKTTTISLVDQEVPNASSTIWPSMSSSDKILKWNLVGIQGALLNLFVDPIYLESLAVGKNYDASHLSRAVCGRASGVSVQAPFKQNSVFLTPVTPVQQELERERNCFDWIQGLWRAVPTESSHNAPKVSEGIPPGQKPPQSISNGNYRDLKASNVAYKTTVESLKQALQGKTVGTWIKKDHFQLNF